MMNDISQYTHLEQIEKKIVLILTRGVNRKTAWNRRQVIIDRFIIQLRTHWLPKPLFDLLLKVSSS